MGSESTRIKKGLSLSEEEIDLCPLTHKGKVTMKIFQRWPSATDMFRNNPGGTLMLNF